VQNTGPKNVTIIHQHYCCANHHTQHRENPPLLRTSESDRRRWQQLRLLTVSKIASHHKRTKKQATVTWTGTTSSTNDHHSHCRTSAMKPSLQPLRNNRERVLKRRYLAIPPWLGTSAISSPHSPHQWQIPNQARCAVALPPVTDRSISKQNDEGFERDFN